MVPKRPPRESNLLFQRQAVKYLSAVALMELRAGATSTRDRRIVTRLEASFERAGRILAPSRAIFAQAGDVLRRLQTQRGYNLAARHSIVNDVLIALSARSIGAIVVTQNGRDYRAIQSVRAFRFMMAA